MATSLPLPIAVVRRVGFILFSRILALCEMQTALPRIWTLVTMSIYRGTCIFCLKNIVFLSWFTSGVDMQSNKLMGCLLPEFD